MVLSIFVLNLRFICILEFLIWNLTIEGMTGFDRWIRFLLSRVLRNPSSLIYGALRANVLNRVKTAFANAFAMPSFAAVVA